MANHIHALQDALRAAADKQARVQEWTAEFRAHLASSKFVGTDTDGGRRDWIATTDVDRRLLDLTMLLAGE